MTRPPLTMRQHMIQGWALLALGRGVLYLPVHTSYGDFPLPLTYLFPPNLVWISGVLWLIISALGWATARWTRHPDWLETAWWFAIIGGTAGWGGMYVSSVLIPGADFRLIAAGELYLAVAYVQWATRGEPAAWEATTARRQRRDRHSPRGK